MGAGTGVVFEYNTFIRSGVRNDGTSLIQKGDKQLILSAFQADGSAMPMPQPNDIATFGGTPYTITAVAPLMPDGTPVYYECNVHL